jgi:hypothetical protein
MVRRFRAFAASIVWTALGLAVGIVVLILAARGLGDDGAVAAARQAWRDGQFWWLVLMPFCVIIGGLWIATVGWRNARSTTALSIQGTVIGLATAMLALLLYLIAAQLWGG